MMDKETAISEVDVLILENVVNEWAALATEIHCVSEQPVC
jgi:hypothetical protein